MRRSATEPNRGAELAASLVAVTVTLTLTLALALGGYACSEATDGFVAPELPELGDGGGGGSSSGGASGTSGSSGGRSPRDAGPPVTASVVLLNEVSASDDWIELVNAGTVDVDLAGWSVADADKDTGEPKTSEAITLPAGTRLAPGEFGLVQAGGLDGGKPCPAESPAFCIRAAFGISNGDGETIFLLGADGGILGTMVYPPSAASGSDTWGRIPSGDPKASFVVNSPTPGAKNEGKP